MSLKAAKYLEWSALTGEKIEKDFEQAIWQNLKEAKNAIYFISLFFDN